MNVTLSPQTPSVESISMLHVSVTAGIVAYRRALVQPGVFIDERLVPTTGDDDACPWFQGPAL
jgi:hypothetical protein